MGYVYTQQTFARNLLSNSSLEPLREVIQHVRDPVYPVPLLPCLGPHVPHRGPEPKGSVPDGQGRRPHPLML